MSIISKYIRKERKMVVLKMSGKSQQPGWEILTAIGWTCNIRGVYQKTVKPICQDSQCMLVKVDNV